MPRSARPASRSAVAPRPGSGRSSRPGVQRRAGPGRRPGDRVVEVRTQVEEGGVTGGRGGRHGAALPRGGPPSPAGILRASRSFPSMCRPLRPGTTKGTDDPAAFGADRSPARPGRAGRRPQHHPGRRVRPGGRHPRPRPSLPRRDRQGAVARRRDRGRPRPADRGRPLRPAPSRRSSATGARSSSARPARSRPPASWTGSPPTASSPSAPSSGPTSGSWCRSPGATTGPRCRCST